MYGLIYLLSALFMIPTFYGLIGSWRSSRGEPKRIWYDSIWAIGSLIIAVTPIHNWFNFIANFSIFVIIGFNVILQLALYYEFEDCQVAYEGWKNIMKDEWNAFKIRTKKRFNSVAQ